MVHGDIVPVERRIVPLGSYAVNGDIVTYTPDGPPAPDSPEWEAYEEAAEANDQRQHEQRFGAGE